MKIAKLVRVTLTTRVIVDENASELDILNAAQYKLIEKIENEIYQNVDSIEDDVECPYQNDEIINEY